VKFEGKRVRVLGICLLAFNMIKVGWLVDSIVLLFYWYLGV
jgi:hypothetical protein